MHPVEAISQRLADFAAERRAEAVAYGSEGAAFVEAGLAGIGGGKGLRARFCLAGWRAGGGAGAPDAAVVAAAAALEVFHAAALVHDDLIDNSDLRRGGPAAHRRLEAWHRGARWQGDGAAFGRSAAVLLGDLLVAWSDDLFEDGLAAAVPERGSAARHEYAVMRRDVTVGQFLDVAEESAYAGADDSTHAARALRVASLKSARYSVQQPLLIGAALAGADLGRRAELRAFGHPLGLAFQLRDDVLGVFGDESVTGKPSGDDLREGKRTVLIALAREAMSVAQRHVLDGALGDAGLDALQVAALQGDIVGSGALARVERMIADLVAEAEQALAAARLDAAVGVELRDLAEAATTRTS